MPIALTLHSVRETTSSTLTFFSHSNPERTLLYLVAIAWLYVAMMMAVAEALHPNGTWLGAIVTFLFYGLLPTGLVMYLMGTPLRRKARLAQEAQALSAPPAGPDAAPNSAADTPLADAAAVSAPPQPASSQTQAAMRPVLPSEPASRR